MQASSGPDSAKEPNNQIYSGALQVKIPYSTSYQGSDGDNSLEDWKTARRTLSELIFIHCFSGFVVSFYLLFCDLISFSSLFLSETRELYEL